MTDEVPTSTLTGGTLVAPSGGDIELNTDRKMDAPGGVQATEYGHAFGALEIIAYPESEARVGGLEFLEARSLIDSLFGKDEDGGLFGFFLFVGAPAAAWRHQQRDAERPEQEENRVSRRDVLRTGLASGLLAGGAAGVAAASPAMTRARFAVVENPGGLRLRIRDRAGDVLPADRTYHVYLDGDDYGTFQPASLDSYGDVLPETAGTVTVGPKGAEGGILSRLFKDRTKEYAGIALEKDIADADAGERLLITDNDIIVDTIQQTGSKNTICTINSKSIPHSHEDRSIPVGYYGINNGEVFYEVGSDPPGGQTADLTVYASRTVELADDAKRRTGQ